MTRARVARGELTCRIAATAPAALLLALSACALGVGFEGDLDPEAVRGPLSAPPIGAPLPPPQAAFEQARSADPAARARARADLDRARVETLGGTAPPDAVSFLDLPTDATIAAPGPTAAVAILPLADAPPAVDRAIRGALLDALGGPVPPARAYFAAERFVLRGTAAAARGSRSVSAILVWTAIAADGRPHHAVETRASAPLRALSAEGDPWSAFTPADLRALGRDAAVALRARPELAALRAPPESATGRAVETARPAAAEPPSVQLVAVTGAPGDGDRALAAALRRELESAGLRVAAEGAPVRIEAEVERRRIGDRDRVRIVWTATRNGRSLGRVDQEAEAPAGALDRAWGDAAASAARAAGPGLIALIVAP